MLKIDFVIPGLNLEEYIGDCIRSIVSSIINAEADGRILYIDDGSTDKTVHIVEQLSSVSLIDIIILSSGSHKAGPGICRNIGINESREGCFLMFVDGDDLIDLNAVSILQSKLETCPDIDILGFQFLESRSLKFCSDQIFVGDITRVRKDLDQLQESKLDLLRCFMEMGMDGSCIFHIYNRRYLLSHNIRFRDGIHEDIDFLFRCFLYSNSRQIVREACT